MSFSDPQQRWRPAALWFALGILLTVALSWLAGAPGISPWRVDPIVTAGANTTTPSFGRLQSTTEGSDDADGGDTPAPVCHLGVVLAQETVDVASEIDGNLREVTVRVGEPVTRGQVIAALDTTSLGHQLAIERATLRTAVADRRRQEIETGRTQQEHQRRLALQGLLSKEEEEKARFQAETASAMFEAAEAEVARVEARIAQLETQFERSEIRAPFDAIVSQRYLDPGAVVRPGAPILRLISAEGLLTRFAVRPEEASSVPIGTPVRVEVELLGLALRGTVEHLAPEIDAASQRIFVEARISGDDLGGHIIDGHGLEDHGLPSGAAARVAAIPQDGAAPRSCFAGQPNFNPSTKPTTSTGGS